MPSGRLRLTGTSAPSVGLPCKTLDPASRRATPHVARAGSPLPLSADHVFAAVELTPSAVLPRHTAPRWGEPREAQGRDDPRNECDGRQAAFHPRRRSGRSAQRQLERATARASSLRARSLIELRTAPTGRERLPATWGGSIARSASGLPQKQPERRRGGRQPEWHRGGGHPHSSTDCPHRRRCCRHRCCRHRCCRRRCCRRRARPCVCRASSHAARGWVMSRTRAEVQGRC